MSERRKILVEALKRARFVGMRYINLGTEASWSAQASVVERDHLGRIANICGYGCTEDEAIADLAVMLFGPDKEGG